MRTTYRANVVLPAAYAKQKKAAFPVLYLLHGTYGHFSDWLAKTPDKQLVHRLADQYNLIVVMPGPFHCPALRSCLFLPCTSAWPSN